MTNRETRRWHGWMVALLLLFLLLEAPYLDRFPPWSGDDGWIMSASVRLARDRILGSEMFTGFFGAERVYFIALPIHHLVQAALFKLVGASPWAARLPSLLGGLVVLATVSRLAYRWHGLAAAQVVGLLLLFWRSDIIAFRWRTPLQAGAHSGRYDLLAVALLWLGILLLDALLRRPTTRRALAAGALAGAATLTQFFGVFLLPLTAIALARRWGRDVWRRRTTRWILVGFLLLVAPYGLYVGANRDEFAGQAALKKGRTSFDEPGFYLRNLAREPRRYEVVLDSPGWRPTALRQRPLGPWILVWGMVPALWLWWRSRPTWRTRTAWLGGGSGLLLALQLALLDGTKAPLYAIVLVPSLCIVFAVAGLELARAAARVGAVRGRLVGAALATLLAIVVVEGAAAYTLHLEQARTIPPYTRVGAEIATYLPPGATVLGSERWWWALRDHPYRSHTSLLTLAALADDAGAWERLVAEHGIDIIIVNNNVHGDVERAPPGVKDAFWTHIENCTTPLADWIDDAYGRIEVVEVVCRGR